MELLTLIPLWYQYVVIGVLGLVIGSFLNVCIYRLHTGRSLQGNSHCLSCGERLWWYELVPVVSYLVLRGRCRNCTARIPSRYLLVELVTASLFLLAFYVYGLSLVMIPILLIVSILVVIAVYDLYHLIIPDELVIGLGVIGVLLLSTGMMPMLSVETGLFFLQHGLAGVVAAGFYASLWWLSKGRWIGFGDVKLALPLGFILGLSAVFSFIVLSFWVGAVMSLVYIGVLQTLKRGQTHLRFQLVPLTIKSEVPFAPFLIISFLLVWWFDVSVLRIFAFTI